MEKTKVPRRKRLPHTQLLREALHVHSLGSGIYLRYKPLGWFDNHKPSD